MDRVHELTAYLTDSGLPRKEKGTVYIAKAISLLESGEIESSPLYVWGLYEAVAEAYDTTPSAVEWDIRTSIRKRKNAKDEKTTNKKFILKTFDRICFES